MPLADTRPRVSGAALLTGLQGSMRGGAATGPHGEGGVLGAHLWVRGGRTGPGSGSKGSLSPDARTRGGIPEEARADRGHPRTQVLPTQGASLLF